MNTAMISLLTLLLALSFIICVDAKGDNTTPCREFKGVSPCVDPPIKKIPWKGKWCPYHICGPSFIRAHECPADGKQATNKCEIKNVVTRVWLCREGKKKSKRVYRFPKRCRGSACKVLVRVCRCRRRKVTQEKLISIGEVSTIC